MDMVVGIRDLLSRGRVWYNIAGDDPLAAIEDAISALSTIPGLFPPGGPGETELAAAVMERETLTSTAMGEGLAFPHPRPPFFRQPADAFIGLFYPRFPVPWGAPDDLPVRAFFILVSANATEHLSILSALAKRCSDTGFKALLDDQAGFERIEAYLEECFLTKPTA